MPQTEPRPKGDFWRNHVDVAKRKSTAKPKPKAKPADGAE
jgi:hypothetical protein